MKPEKDLKRKIGITAGGLVLAFLVFRIFFSGEKIVNQHPGGTNIICFGDSLTYGTGAEEGNDYPAVLEKLLGEKVINKGIPGNTTEDALLRLQEDVLSLDPKIVFITLGGNDLKNNVPKDRAFANLSVIIARIQEKGALVVLGGIDFPLRGRGFGDAYKKLAKEKGVILVPNVLEGLFGNNEYMSDPIHPNGRGYAVMARRFYAALKPYL